MTSPTEPLTSTPPTRAQKKSRWGLGLLFLFLLPIGMCAPLCVVAGGGGKPGVPDAVVLEIDLENAVIEGQATPSLLHSRSSSKQLLSASRFVPVFR